MSDLSDMRTVEQNKIMWGMLGDLAKQQRWPVNGSMIYMTSDDWKDVMTAALRKHHRIASGIDGGAVVLGMRTSKMLKTEMTDLIELMLAFGANREPQIIWTHEQKQLAEMQAVKDRSPYVAH